MRFRIVVGVIYIALLATTCKSAELPDESAMAPHVDKLRSEKSEVREAAAKALREWAEKNEKSVIQTEAYWKEKASLVKIGMSSAEVYKLLPPFPPGSSPMGVGSGQSHTTSHRVDYHWTVTIYYRNPDGVMEAPPVLSRSEMSVWVSPPQDYSGKWLTWFTNGQKAHEIEYKNGKYDGAFISYHDNGKVGFTQHYTESVIDGTDKGFYRDGKIAYEGTYLNGKQDGTWTWWYNNGWKRSEKSYKNGVNDGPDISWYENGQKQYEFNYKNGKKHGLEASWDEKGKLHYSRQYVDGKLPQ